jgi:hypothetical protein
VFLQNSINYAGHSEQGENDSRCDLRFSGSRLLAQFALLKPCAPGLFVEYSRVFGYYQHRCVHIKTGSILKAIGKAKAISPPSAAEAKTADRARSNDQMQSVIINAIFFVI